MSVPSQALGDVNAVETPAPLEVGVVVLGMGRSGTSAITRMFASAGFFAGHEDDLLPAAESNPAGHWENVGIWRANEQILKQLGGSWFDPPSTAVQLAARGSAIPALRVEIERLVQLAQDEPIVIKDPRIGVMMPLWSPILANRLHPVLAVRDPFEIALSLYRRDGTPHAYGLAAWELHMTSLLNYLNNQIVTVAPYTSLLEDDSLASTIVRVAASHIDPALTSRLRPADAFRAFEPGLHHNHASQIDHREYLTTRQFDLWRLLSALPPGDQSIEVPIDLRTSRTAARMMVRRETERVARDYDDAQRAHDLASERERVQHLIGSLAHEQRTAHLSIPLRTKHDRARTAEAAGMLMERELTSTRRTVNWRITAPLRAVKRLLRNALGNAPMRP